MGSRARSAAVALCLVGCAGHISGDDPPEPAPGCPNDLPQECSLPAPGYESQIVPVIGRRCFPCHLAGGAAGARWVFSDYEALYERRSPILNAVYACAMPPTGASPLTAEERENLLEWLVCHAPDDD